MTRRSSRRVKPLIPLLLLPMIVLTGCASASKVQPVVTVVDNSCQTFKQMSWSVGDTKETSTQVRQHNATYAALCPKAKE